MDAADHYMTPTPRIFPVCSLQVLQYFGDPVRGLIKKKKEKETDYE